MAKTKRITQAYLKSILHYDRDTGIFTWRRESPKRAVGEVAGSRRPENGAICIKIDGVIYRASHLAVAYCTGEFPTEDVRHRDGNKSNNRISNLVCCSRSETTSRRRQPKNSTGFTGVVQQRNGKFAVQINIGRKKRHVGGLDTAEKAAEIYKAAAKSRLFGFVVKRAYETFRSEKRQGAYETND